MTSSQIDRLLSGGTFPDGLPIHELAETHISWVILGPIFVYKIKKPMHYSFLDFSTLERRKYYCEREIELNNRLTRGLYIDVLPIREDKGEFTVGGTTGEITDYAVRMNRLDSDKQMDILLRRDRITAQDIGNLASVISDFHRRTLIIGDEKVLQISVKFNALLEEKGFLEKQLGKEAGAMIDRCTEQSDSFLSKCNNLLRSRLQAGFFRDCHGDLHTRNIFLLPDPVIFDCIEFNDEYRQIDVLNEVAFLCMDLDAFGRTDLSEQFISIYNRLLPAMRDEEEKLLFTYYKSYRANVRAKVNSLRARDATDHSHRKAALTETEKYLRLMQNYLTGL